MSTKFTTADAFEWDVIPTENLVGAMSPTRVLPTQKIETSSDEIRPRFSGSPPAEWQPGDTIEINMNFGNGFIPPQYVFLGNLWSTTVSYSDIWGDSSNCSDGFPTCANSFEDPVYSVDFAAFDAHTVGFINPRLALNFVNKSRSDSFFDVVWL